VLTLEILPRPTCPVGRFSSFYRSMTPRIIAILLVGFALACDSPARPLPQTQPPAPAPQTRLNLSGVVTDDNGAPIPDVSISLSDALGGGARLRTRTNASGRYDFDSPDYLSLPRFISASNAERWSVQPLEWGTGSTAVKNLRLRRIPNVVAGQSIVVSFEQDSSLCVWEWSVSDSMSCEHFILRTEAPGLVTVEARPLDGGSIPTFVGWENPGASDRFSVRLSGVGTLWMNLSARRGFTTVYEVKTWFER
jgi:hypothetical protein